MGTASSARSRPSWCSCSRARCHARRAACRRGSSLASSAAIDQLDLVSVEAIGQHLIGDDGVRRSPGHLLDGGGELHGLRHRHLGRRADQRDCGARRVGEEVAYVRGLMPDRPHAAEPAEGGGCLQQPHGVAGRGRVHDDEPAVAAPAGQIPRLAHGDELAGTGRGGDEVAEGVGAGQQRGARAPDVPGHPLLEGGVGSMRDAAQPGASSSSAPGPAGARPKARASWPRAPSSHTIARRRRAAAGQSERRGHDSFRRRPCR